MNINLHEFVWLWQGIVKKKFTQDDLPYLEPIFIERENNERAILLLHGFGSTPYVYRDLLSACLGYDAVKVPVLPGHASSFNSFAKTRAQEWLDCAKEEYTNLAAKYKKVDVLGLSLGGLLACHIASLFRPNHLYLLAPALFLNFPLNLGPTLPKFLNKIGIKSVRSQGGDIHQSDKAELTYARLPITTIIEVLTLIYNFKFSLPSCPTDLFLGKYDAAVNSPKIKRLFKNSTNTKIHWLTHSAHVLPLDTDQNLIASLIQTNLIKG